MVFTRFSTPSSVLRVLLGTKSSSSSSSSSTRSRLLLLQNPSTHIVWLQQQQHRVETAIRGYQSNDYNNNSTTNMSQTPQASVALIVCSTRTPRVGPDISSWVENTIRSSRNNATLTTLDLANFPLPISPHGTPLPAQVPLPLPATPYGEAAVNAWSQEVRKYGAFIFVTPQYNWSFPAALKCAIDHLFYEWVGKPALIVSYGGSGGGKATAQLREVLQGLRMHPWPGKVELPLAEGIQQAVNGVLADTVVEAWREAGKTKELQERWEELVALVVQASDRS